jgi:hypothetical protein
LALRTRYAVLKIPALVFADQVGSYINVQSGKVIIVMLGGVTKSTQLVDIIASIAIFQNYWGLIHD